MMALLLLLFIVVIVVNVSDDPDSASFKYKKTRNDITKNFQTMVPLKHLSNF